MNIMRREREDKKTNGIYKNGNRISVTKNIVEQKVIFISASATIKPHGGWGPFIP